MDKRLSQLGILQSHIEACRIPREDEAIVLVDGGVDVFDRPIRMTPEAFTAWVTMRDQADNDLIELQIVSAYRSIDYQCELFLKKLSRGVLLDEILKVNAIPGFSQHHTGRALDLTTLDYQPLEIEFESSSAFAWLQKNAGHYGFVLSYPSGNDLGIDYEPWHWAYIDNQ